GQEQSHGAEEAAFAAGSRRSSAARCQADADTSNQDEMRNCQNQSRSRREPVPVGEGRLYVDRNGIWHGDRLYRNSDAAAGTIETFQRRFVQVKTPIVFLMKSDAYPLG